MSPFEQMARYGAYIPVMSEHEQALLAEGRLHPSVIRICQWCEALTRREMEREKRFAEAMEKGEKPLENRNGKTAVSQKTGNE